MGPAGGTLHLGNGARLEIERGSLTEEVEVVFKEGADGRAFEDGAHQRPLGPMLAVEPPLLGRFVISVPEQSIPSGFDLEDLALGMEEVDQQRAFGSATQTRWQFYRASVDGGRLVARVEALAGHRVRFGVAR